MLPRLRVVLLALTLVTSAIAVVFVTGEIRRANRILSYDVDYVLTADGSLRVVETVERRYIRPGRRTSRWFGDSTTSTLPIEDLEVRLDGKRLRYGVFRNRDGEIGFVAGDADRLLIGDHRFEYSYRVPDAVYDNDLTRVFQRQLLVRYPVPIERSRVSIRLPVPAHDLGCRTAGDEGCGLTGEGTRDLVIKTGRLEPGTTVVLWAAFDGRPAG